MPNGSLPYDSKAIRDFRHPGPHGDWRLGGSLRELPAPDLGRRDSTSNPASHHSNNGFADSQSKRE